MLGQTSRDLVELGVALAHCDSRLHPADKAQEMTVTLQHFLPNECLQWQPIIARFTLHGEAEAGRHHSYDGVGTKRHAHFFPDDSRITVEQTFPCLVAEHDDARAAVF